MTFVFSYGEIPPSKISADNPDECGEIVEENFAISYPEKFLSEKFPGLYP